MKKHILLFTTIFAALLTSCNVFNPGDYFNPDDQGEKNKGQLVLSGTYKTIFEFNEYYSVSGMIVTCNNEVVNDVTYSPFMVGNRLTEVGDFTVTVSKENYLSATYSITVNPEKALSIAHEPNKVDYVVGEYFDATGLVIKDEKNSVVSDYTLDVTNGTQLKRAGEYTVTATKEGYKSASFTINVEEDGSSTIINKTLKFYYVNDFHGSFSKMSKYYEPGMSVVSKYIRDNVKSDPNNSFVLSGGDMFQGGYESNESQGMVMVDAMNIVGFDAMALGNHEFDWGENAIRNISQELDCPILSCNVFYANSETRPSWISPYTIITRDNVTVGIIGAAQYNLGSSIDGTISSEFSFPSPNSYIKEFSTQLRKNQGCDIVIALFHDEGYDADSQIEPTKFNDITQVDPETNLPYVDAMFFSHDHYRKAGIYNSIPYIESQCNGKYVGTLTLPVIGNGVSYTVDYENIPIPTNLDAYNCLSTTDSEVDAITSKAEYALIMSKASQVIYNFSKDYTKEEFTYVACMAMYWYVNENKSKFGGETVYFASHNTGGVRAKVYSGQFTYKELIKIFPFDNPLVIQTCTSSNISYMSNSSYYRTYQSGDPVYSGGYTKAVTITYISEYRVRPDGSNSCQVSRIIYNDYTAKDALVSYLTNGGNSTL